MYDQGRPRLLRGFFLCLLNILFLSHNVHSIEYSIEVYTQLGNKAGTEDSVSVTIVGTEGTPAKFDLANPIGRSDNIFHPGSVNRYKVDINEIGIPCKVTLTLGGTDGWTIGNVYIERSDTHVGQLFQCQREIDDKGSTTETVAVNGGWSQWTMWGKCSASCGQSGSQTRMRTCTDPSPGCSGSNCSGNAEDTRDCFGQPCPTTASTSTPATIDPALKPMNGGWSQWTVWGNCSASCGQSGSQTRMRTCTDPSPGCGGRQCSGSAEDARDCFGKPCPTTTSTSTPATIGTALKPNSCTSTDVRDIGLGILLSLAVILSIILAVYLAVVRRDKRAFKKLTKNRAVVVQT